MLKSWQIEGFGEEQKGILMIVWLENRTITGKKMNRGIYVIIVIGESLFGEKNLILILEIIQNYGKNVIGENKKSNPVDLYFKVMELGDNCSIIRGNHDEWLAAYILKYYQMPEGKRKKQNHISTIHFDALLAD